jgi:hypothetical protein
MVFVIAQIYNIFDIITYFRLNFSFFLIEYRDNALKIYSSERIFWRPECVGPTKIIARFQTFISF